MEKQTTQESLNTQQGAEKIRALNVAFSKEQEYTFNNFKCGLIIPEELAKQQMELCATYQRNLLDVYRNVAKTTNESEEFVRGNLRALLYNY